MDRVYGRTDVLMNGRPLDRAYGWTDGMIRCAVDWAYVRTDGLVGCTVDWAYVRTDADGRLASEGSERRTNSFTDAI